MKLYSFTDTYVLFQVTTFYHLSTVAKLGKIQDGRQHDFLGNFF